MSQEKPYPPRASRREKESIPFLFCRRGFDVNFNGVATYEVRRFFIFLRAPYALLQYCDYCFFFFSPLREECRYPKEIACEFWEFWLQRCNGIFIRTLLAQRYFWVECVFFFLPFIHLAWNICILLAFRDFLQIMQKHYDDDMLRIF